ncbi:Protein disulfide-isomerase A3, partial [Fragariocoptes setiger]
MAGHSIMRYLLTVIVATLSVGHIVSADDAVIDLSALDTSAFKAELATHDLILVEFFAPWCGHCKRLAPEYEKAAELLKTNDPPVPLAKIDCTSDNGKLICQENGVNGYPTLKIFRSGDDVTDYEGPRDAEGIASKLRSLAGPASKLYDSYEKLATLYKTTTDTVVVGLFASESDSLSVQFQKVANKLRNQAKFAHIYSDKATDKYEHFVPVAGDSSISEPAVLLVRSTLLRSKFEPDHLSYDSSEDLEDWIKDNYNGLVGYRTPTTAQEFSKPYIVAYYDVDYVKNPKGTNYWRNRVLKVATNYKGEGVTFAISSTSSMGGELSEYGYEHPRGQKEQTPFVAGQDKDGQKFVMKEKFSVDAFDKFVKQFIAGELEPYMKSEDLPEDNDSVPVKVAVAKNFKELVTKSNKDVFIEFYAPWCGHCKSLAPTWEQLGTKLAKESGVIIAKLDATANDIPSEFVVHGFPTLYWYPKNTKTPVKYEGGRDINDLLGYVAKHATDELEGYDRSGQPKERDEL